MLYPRCLLLALALVLLPAGAAAQPAALARLDDLDARLQQFSLLERGDVLWLARSVYSESDRTHEQRLVAWVVRNRVETSYRGRTYREVVLEPRQFSAFNNPTPRRRHILSLDEHSRSSAWRQALGVALEVYQAPASQRPFTKTTRHFYSPVSMRGRTRPDWAVGATALPAARLGIDPHRFQFFADVDDQYDPSLVPPDRPVGVTRVVSAGSAAKRLSTKRLSARSRLQSRGFSGRVKRPVRPHLQRRLKR